MKKNIAQEMTLLRELKIKQKISVNEAMDLLSISESTARRLFIRLEKSGAAIRSHGSIVLAQGNFTNPYFYENASELYIKEKEQIALNAVKLLEDNDVVYLDSGSTLSQFSMAVAAAIQNEELKNITVFTNSLVNLQILSSYASVILTGGEYRVNRKDFFGYVAEESVKKLSFKKCFLGCDGYSKEQGFTATDFYTARLNSVVSENSQQKIILADSSKFNSPSVVAFSKLENVTAIVTDSNIDEQMKQHFTENNIQIFI